MERALARGDLDPDAPLDLIGDLLVGPLFWRLLMTGEPLDDAFAQRLVEGVLRGLGPPAPSRVGRAAATSSLSALPTASIALAGLTVRPVD